MQLPGRENRLRDLPFGRLSPLVQVLEQALRPYLDKPFFFFGHSMGSLVSFELARQLRRQKAPEPLHLFVSGRAAPQIPHQDPPIHQLADAAFVEALRRYNGTPEAVLQNRELMDLFLPLLRADFAVNETYVYTPEAALNCPISAFGGLQDTEVSREDLAGWRNQTNSTFTLRMFSGDHFFLNRDHSALLQFISQKVHQISAGQLRL